MSKIKKVILKDLRNRLSKRWFWILSLMGPLIFMIMILVPIGLNMKTTSAKVIEVWQDPKGTLPVEELPKNENTNYMIASGNLDFLLTRFLKSKHDVFVVIPAALKNEKILIYQKTMLSREIKNRINKDLEDLLKLNHLKAVYSDAEIDKLSSTLSYSDIPLASQNNSAQMAIGLVVAIVIYYFTFSYSVQVMRNVMEEKTNRVVEVILVAMKPWELMFAKILGGSLLGLIQFSVWVLLTLSLIYPIYGYFELDRFSSERIFQTLQTIQDVDNAMEMNYIVSSISNISWGSILPGIFLYFGLGYLLYSSMFAAIGAAVDQDAETQLFIMPVTAPLAISIVFIQFVAEHPDHIWSQFLAVFPLTSPVIAPIKIVTHAMPPLELLISILTMVSSIALIIYISGKIFKAGILNYGNSATWKELFKWAKS